MVIDFHHDAYMFTLLTNVHEYRFVVCRVFCGAIANKTNLVKTLNFMYSWAKTNSSALNILKLTVLILEGPHLQ